MKALFGIASSWLMLMETAEAFYNGASSGPMHMGMGGANLRTRIHFARIYGQSSVFGNLPLQDYMYLEHTKLAEDKQRFEMRAWKNISGGGSKTVADGNKYCNMSAGEMTLFTNRGKSTIDDTDAEGYWDPSPGIIFRPPRSIDRQDLYLQDCDGDGDCDIIYVNSETNAMEVFLNRYPQTDSWGWTHLTNPAPGLTCGYKRGLGVFDLAVRFTENNRADYLCIAPDGTVSGNLQQDSGVFVDVGQIKFAIGKDRAILRFADVNGDGKDDMLWMEKFSGDTWVWYNGDHGSPDTPVILQDSKARYNEIMASGYDKYFKIYADHLVSNAWSALRNFMRKHSDEYVTCKITEETTCCNIRYNGLCSDKEGDFWDAAAAEVGAPREKMNIAKLQSIGTLDSSCSRDAVYNGIEHMTASCYYRNFWFDAPQVEEFSTDDVTNPKTILNKALGDAKPLIDPLSASLFEIQAISWEADPEDIVDSMSKELEQADKKSFILNLRSPIFIVISMGGSTLTSAGLTSLGRAFVVIGEVAGIGLGIYDMVQTSSATPLDLFRILFSVKGICDVSNAQKAALARRAMPHADIARISTKVAPELEQISWLPLNLKPCRYF
ncbi:hypothetical protein K4K55_007212 [Colletotrichum sp. SAR 10_96]|nr:hypothetical protein K4K55_007212 [Colletotrichum sp. SAR 10_96]